jgi:hypothetical protein
MPSTALLLIYPQLPAVYAWSASQVLPSESVAWGPPQLTLSNDVEHGFVVGVGVGVLVNVCVGGGVHVCEPQADGKRSYACFTAQIVEPRI